MKKKLTNKQKENLRKHNERQKAQRQCRRNKICAWCKKPFIDNSKRLSQRTCSKECSSKWGVFKRKQSGSYKRTKEQNEKMVFSLQNARKEGRCKISNEKREYLSRLLKKRWEDGEMLLLSKETNIEKYGVEHPMRNEKVKQKLRNTFLKKYGVENPNQAADIKEKTKRTRLERGYTYKFEERTMKDWAESLGVSYSYFKQVVNEDGFEKAKKLSLSKTGIENIIFTILNKMYSKEIVYNYTGFKQYRPDFLLPNKKIIIECDGLAWHCDRICQDKKYHYNKKLFYSENGYKALFFRSNEIKNKEEIVKSIIANALKINKRRFYARKLQISSISKENGKAFLIKNHLMGPGAGRFYGLKDDNGELLAIIQVKWKSLKNKIIEISRFCTALHTTIVGGYSRLVSHVIEKEKPNKIITFVDERYGTGEYLIKLGFIKKRSGVSFNWTDGKATYHRMRFPGNSGYKNGLYKIWDCGQTLFVRSIDE